MDTVRAYHERSKHQLEHYAPGPGGLDWVTQPDPFRRYDGASLLELPLLAAEVPVRWDELFTVPGAAPQDFNATSVGGMLELSLGLSAWKSWGGNRWALRCNPSSGNLHPTEGYLICPDLPGLPSGVHHYRPDRHALERRTAASFGWSGGVLMALTGIAWREAWKYGLRAFRYCQHDCGHALAALAYAAAVFGWPARRLEWGDEQIGALTGVDRHDEFHAGEPEHPEALVWIGPGQAPDAAAVLAALAGDRWRGTANRLSVQQRDWPDIPEVTAATVRPGGALDNLVNEDKQASLAALPPGSSSPASALIRGRRSAQAFDGATSMTMRHFQRLLDALLLRPGVPPWSLTGNPSEVHLIFFIHRVEGLPPGIYALPRAPAAYGELRTSMGGDWLWERVVTIPAMPEHLPFYLLAPLDVLGFAATASCHQDIAADSAFMVAMLARFDDLAGGCTVHGWRYRQRFHEAGMLGQVLYLEAEAGGLQGTGIGCYFDDVVHRALQLDTTQFQDFYHFTVGKALVDQRLGNETGYALLGARSAPSAG